jgi:hypothetical protein
MDHHDNDDIARIARERKSTRQQDKLHAGNLKLLSGPIRSSLEEKDPASIRHKLGKGRPQTTLPTWDDDGRYRPSTGQASDSTFMTQFETRRQPINNDHGIARKQEPLRAIDSKIVGYREDNAPGWRRKPGTADRPMAAGPIRALNASYSTKDMSELLATTKPAMANHATSNGHPRTPPVLLFEDIDDREEFSYGLGQDLISSKVAMPTLRPAKNNYGYSFGRYEAYPIELQTAMDMRNVLFGSIAKTFPFEWTRQTFIFNDLPNLKFGLIQDKVFDDPFSCTVFFLFLFFYDAYEPTFLTDFVFSFSVCRVAHAVFWQHSKQ